MSYAIVALAAFAGGVYCGKKRASGRSWNGTVCDLAGDIFRAADSAREKVSSLFRRESDAHDDESEGGR